MGGETALFLKYYLDDEVELNKMNGTGNVRVTCKRAKNKLKKNILVFEYLSERTKVEYRAQTDMQY